MEKLEDVLRESTPSTPTAFQQFCQKKIDEFRQCVALEISRPLPVSDKLKKLVELILQLHGSGHRGNGVPSSSIGSRFRPVHGLVGLVLVRTKFHTTALEEYLSQQSALKERQIAVGHLTGQGSADELSLPGTQQATVLNQFRKGTKNLLVATGRPFILFSSKRAAFCTCADVAQEGLDVAECSYVIRYEFVSNEIGSVQSRGRARAAQSQCFLITEAREFNL